MMPKIGSGPPVSPEEQIVQKQTQLKYLNKLVKLISDEQSDVNSVRKCLGKCGDSAFVKKYVYQVDNFSGLTDKQKSSWSKKISDVKGKVERDVRALERKAGIVSQPEPERVSRKRARGDEIPPQIVKEEEGFLSHVMQAASDFAYKHRRQSAGIAALAVSLATNYPALKEITDWTEFMGACVYVVADAGKTRVLMSPFVDK